MVLRSFIFLSIEILLQGDLVWTIRGRSERRFVVSRVFVSKGLMFFSRDCRFPSLKYTIQPLIGLDFSISIDVYLCIYIYIYFFKWLDVLSSGARRLRSVSVRRQYRNHRPKELKHVLRCPRTTPNSPSHTPRTMSPSFMRTKRAAARRRC